MRLPLTDLSLIGLQASVHSASDYLPSLHHPEWDDLQLADAPRSVSVPGTSSRSRLQGSDNARSFAKVGKLTPAGIIYPLYS